LSVVGIPPVPIPIPEEIQLLMYANDIVTDVITKVFKVTKALIVFKNVLKTDDPVVDVIANKRGRHTLAEAALKLEN
jgi:hypothetical protein